MTIIKIDSKSIYEISGKKLFNQNIIKNLSSSYNDIQEMLSYSIYNSGGMDFWEISDKTEGFELMAGPDALIKRIDNPSDIFSYYSGDNYNISAHFKNKVKIDANVFKDSTIIVKFSYTIYKFQWRYNKWFNLKESINMISNHPIKISDIIDDNWYLDFSKIAYLLFLFVIYEYPQTDKNIRNVSVANGLAIEVLINSCKQSNIELSNGNDFNYYPNELMQNKTIVDNNTKNIISNWRNGKKTLHLKVKYGKYDDINGNNVYNGVDGNLIQVGDIVRPFDEYGKPIMSNGDKPVDFEVLSSEFNYEGYPYLELDLIEV